MTTVNPYWPFKNRKVRKIVDLVFLQPVAATVWISLVLISSGLVTFPWHDAGAVTVAVFVFAVAYLWVHVWFHETGQYAHHRPSPRTKHPHQSRAKNRGTSR